MSVNLRIWGLGCGAGVVAVLAGGFFLGVQPALASTALVDQQTATLAAQNQSSMITLAALAKQGAKLDEMQAQQAVLMKAVPEILKPNTFVRRVNEVAAVDNVVVQGIAPSEAVQYTAPVPVAGAPALAVTDPAITPANFAVVPVTVQVSGAQTALLQFAHDIQTDQRLFLISSISSATADDGTATTSFGGYIYALQR